MLQVLLLLLVLVNISVLPDGNVMVQYQAHVNQGPNTLPINPAATGVVVVDAKTGEPIPFEHSGDKLKVYVNSTNITQVKVTYTVPKAAAKLGEPGWWQVKLPEFNMVFKYYAGKVEVPVRHNYYYFHPLYAAAAAGGGAAVGAGVALAVARRKRHGGERKTQESGKPPKEKK